MSHGIVAPFQPHGSHVNEHYPSGTKQVLKCGVCNPWVRPHLNDYDEICRNFSWDAVAEELKLPRHSGYNLATICLDDHPADVMQKPALTWHGAKDEKAVYTFNDMCRETNRFANVLANLDVHRQDRVFVFLERIPELFISFFGALKFGAVVGPLFSAFGPEAIKDRVQDCGAKVIVTSPALIDRIREILPSCPTVKQVIVVNRSGQPIEYLGNELSYEALMAEASETFETPQTHMDDYSIIHYTSGTTGKPKGAVHRHYSVLAQYITTKYVLDLHEDDRYWCTADPGWVTGTSYGMIGPWSNGVGIFVYEGAFSPAKWYELIQQYKITVWYTAPTAIRMLMKSGDELPKKYDMSSLRHLASVGEPLNPEAIIWGQKVFNETFHDTWWQTETGAMHIVNYPTVDVRTGSMGKPFPGVEAGILDDNNNPLPPGHEGKLALKPTAPSIFRTYWKKEEMYQSKFQNGWYITGDRAFRDEENYFWFIGRDDDVINTAGHLVGPFEVESALVEHPAVAEAAVIGKPDPDRLEIVKAFVSLTLGYEASPQLVEDIQQFVRKRLAAHAYPREIEIIDNLPKTRSGKIMRRLLKARELGLPEGDTSTLE